MLTFRPYEACTLFKAVIYKHCVPTGLVRLKRGIPANTMCFEGR
jgi:hypothetical protein